MPYQALMPYKLSQLGTVKKYTNSGLGRIQFGFKTEYRYRHGYLEHQRIVLVIIGQLLFHITK